MKPTHVFRRGLKPLDSGIRVTLVLFASVAFAGAQAQTNTRTGVQAGLKTTTGSHNTANGFVALTSNITGDFNTAIGSNSLRFSTGTNNTAVGFQSLFRNKTGNFNVAVGDGALLNNLAGSFNIGVGEDAGNRIKNGSNNIAIGNKGFPTDNGNIRIGTPGVHKNTFIAGVIRGNGSGLKNLKIPTSGLTGKISSGQIAPAAITAAQLAPAAVTTAKLAPDLVLSGNTTGTFTGNLTGNADTATSATNAAGLLGPNLKLSIANVGSFGGTTAFQFNGTSPGVLLETNQGGEAGGLFLNGNTAVIYSPGDQDVLRVYDEDSMGGGSPVPAFTVLNANLGIRTPGDVKLGDSLSAVGGGEQLRILRGSVTSSGSIAKGSGFTVTKNSTGLYTINFATPFTSAPSFTCTLIGSQGHIVGNLPGGASTTSFQVYTTTTTDAAADRNFDFIVIGPR